MSGDTLNDMPVREFIATLRKQATELPREQMIMTMFIHVMANRVEEQVNLADKFRALLEAVLMFHRGGEWTATDSTTWLRLTGTEGASTKELCDAIREALA
jgi:hypothetical protein